MGGCLDIHDQKEAAEKLRSASETLGESEERLRLAQQVGTIGTFEWNLQTNANRWTPELEAIYGLRPGEFAGTQEAWEQMIYPEDRIPVIRRVRGHFRLTPRCRGNGARFGPTGVSTGFSEGGRFSGTNLVSLCG